MRKSAYIIIGALAITACGKRLRGNEALRAAAEEYYGYLIEGNVDKYVGGIHDYDSLPEEYQSQLCDMMAQYLAYEDRQHGGITHAKATRDTIIDSIHAQVFLDLTYGDSTIEQINVPMILTDDGWKLK